MLQAEAAVSWHDRLWTVPTSVQTMNSVSWRDRLDGRRALEPTGGTGNPALEFEPRPADAPSPPLEPWSSFCCPVVPPPASLRRREACARSSSTRSRLRAVTCSNSFASSCRRSSSRCCARFADSDATLTGLLEVAMDDLVPVPVSLGVDL